MGADFFLSCCPIASGQKDWAERTHEEYTSYLSNIDSEMLVGVAADELGLDDMTDQETRESFQAIIDEYFGEAGGWGYRDCCTMTLDGKDYLFSGGMSWGDDPSNSWSNINILAFIYDAGSPLSRRNRETYEKLI